MNHKILEKIKKNIAIIIPTDTIYGISMVYSTDNQAYINKLKKRPKDQKLIILYSKYSQIKNIVILNKEIKKFINQNKKTTLLLKNINNEKIAVRKIKLKWLRKIINKSGPIFSTSANFSKEIYIEDKNIFEKIVGADNVFYQGHLNNQASRIYDFSIKKYKRIN